MRWICIWSLVACGAVALVAGEVVDDRAAVKAELARIADGIKLPKAIGLIHKLVAPSVVSVHIKTHQLGIDPLRKEIHRREVALGEGSGFIVQSDAEASYVLTNAHVVLQRNRGGEFIRDELDKPVWQPLIRVVLNDTRSFEGEPVGADPETDLAVLRLQAPELPAVEWGDSDAVVVGDWVVALGYPLGVGYSASAGIISATGRSTGVYRAEHGYESFLQTDAAINPGNSGGPLVGLRGRVVGVNSNILSAEHGKNIGIGFAISSNLARNVARDLIEDGQISRPIVGVRMSELSAAAAAEAGLTGRKGVKIEWVMPQSPAATAGLEQGDVILSLDGQPVRGIQQFRTGVASRPIGRPFTLTVWRGRVELAVEVTPISWDEFNRLVMEELKKKATVMKGYGLYLGDDSFPGVPVVGVDEESPAERAGIEAGDRVLSVLGHGQVGRPADLKRFDAAAKLVLKVYRNRRALLVRLER